MARNQVVMPGFAAFHVGIQTDEAPVDEAIDTATGETSIDTATGETSSDSVDYVDSMSE